MMMSQFPNMHAVANNCSPHLQMAAFNTSSGDMRTRVVIATNVAESSVTLPDVHTVSFMPLYACGDYVPTNIIWHGSKCCLVICASNVTCCAGHRLRPLENG